MNKRPSEAQRVVLQRLVDGWKLYGGTHDVGPIQQRAGGETAWPSRATISVLWKRGWIVSGKRLSGPGLSTPYHITDAGRAVLAVAEEVPHA